MEWGNIKTGFAVDRRLRKGEGFWRQYLKCCFESFEAKALI
jgi:hypothetical protein